MDLRGCGRKLIAFLFESFMVTVRASQVTLAIKNPPANAQDARDKGSVPGLGRPPGGGKGSPLYILAWRIPWTEELGGLWSKALQRVGHT